MATTSGLCFQEEQQKIEALELELEGARNDFRVSVVVGVCVCVCVCVCACVCVHICVCGNVHVHVHISVCTVLVYTCKMCIVYCVGG